MKILAQTIIYLVSIYVCIAAIGKFIAIDEFMASLSTWTVIPSDLHPIIAIIVPSAELVLSLSIILSLNVRRAAIALAGMLVIFTGLYMYQSIVSEAPDCNCLGKIKAFESLQASASYIIVRNMILIIMLIMSLLFTKTSSKSMCCGSRHHDQAGNSVREDNTSRAFTAVELLVTLALISIIVAMLMPTLGSVRDRARDAQALAHLKQHSTVFALYSQDWNGLNPYFAEQYATSTVVRGDRYTVSFSYFSSNTFWQFALLDIYYENYDINDPVFLSPYQREYMIGDTPYKYSCSMIARPEYWDLRTRTGRDQLRPTRLHEIAYPSSKGLMSIDPWLLNWDYEVVLSQNQLTGKRTLVATLDGSARENSAHDLGETVSTGDGAYDDTIGGHRVGYFPSAMHTLQGVRGRDTTK